MNGTGSGTCTMVVFEISDAEPLGSVTREVILIIKKETMRRVRIWSCRLLVSRDRNSLRKWM